MGYMGILLGICVYLLRVDFSMAMVCMVKTEGQDTVNATSHIDWYITVNNTNITLKDESHTEECKEIEKTTDDDFKVGMNFFLVLDIAHPFPIRPVFFLWGGGGEVFQLKMIMCCFFMSFNIKYFFGLYFISPFEIVS